MKKLIIIILLSTLTSCNGYNFYDLLSTFGDPSPHLARSIRFDDTDYTANGITGILSFSPALNESNITEYRLYLGVNASTKHPSGMIRSFTPNGGIQTTIPADILNYNITGATHFLIYSVKGTDEMTTPASLKIQDLVVELFKDIRVGPNPSNPTGFTLLDGLLYFGADDGSGSGSELWTTDGIDNTVAHTKKVFPGITMSGAWNNKLVKSGNLIFFRASQGALGEELWYFDSSLPVPVPVCLAIDPVGTGSNPSQPVVINGKLYFSATESGDTELFVYEIASGYSLGVNPMKINLNSAGNSFPWNLTIYNGKLYFSAFNVAYGITLWELNPSNLIVDNLGLYDTGTNPRAIDLDSGSSSNPSYLKVFNNKLYFQALQAASGIELWVLDSSALSTGPYDSNSNPKLIDLYSGPGNSSDPKGLTVFNDKLVFSATDGIHGVEAWISDGTLSGSHMIRDQNLAGDSLLGSPFIFNNKIYMSLTANPANGNQLGISDGTFSGTKQVIINSVGDSFPQYFASLNGMVYFIADRGGGDGFQVWRTDGTTTYPDQLTINLLNTNPVNKPKELTEYNGKIYFSGTNFGGTNTELYVLYYK